MTPELMEKAIAAGQDCGSLTDGEAVDLYEEYRALLRRDWAVRVLDAQLARMMPQASWETTSGKSGAHYVSFTDTNRDSIDGPWDPTYGPTPDAARHAAALAVFATLDADVRKQIGECP